MTVRLATGALITLMKRVLGLHYTLEDSQNDDDFIVMNLEDKFEVILGLPWFRRYEPRVSWQHRIVKMPATCSSDGHLMNVLERRQACGCTAIECDGLTCGTVISTTVQDHSVITNHTVEEGAGGFADAQATPKVYHSNKSSDRDMDLCLSDRHPRKNKPVAHVWQHDDPRSTRQPTVEDLAVVAQPHPEDAERISPN
uniref:RxLR effector candidate protein n=1 Tax=Hyaloperonospora arabidopsidis (strain Emoy2) TaxID=559515 RepID=M4BYH8_HYAAE